MSGRIRALVMEARDVERAITRIAHEIVEHNRGTDALAIVGLQTRGVYLAHRLAKKIASFEGVHIPVGSFDITLYRDDLQETGRQPILKATEIDFSVDGKTVVVADDVLYTGRTIRAALDGLMDLGRPRRIRLAVLIDRGHRELPIRADYVGKNVPTAAREDVVVHLQEEDGKDEVLLCEPPRVDDPGRREGPEDLE